MPTSIFLSDLHIASKKCKAKQLNNFLKNIETDQIFLVGDIIDAWRFHQSFKFSIQEQIEHINVIRKLLKHAAKKQHVYYVYGNHDEIMEKFGEVGVFGNISVCERTSYISSNNKKYLVIHGQQFDILSKYNWGKFIGKIGDVGYEILIDINEVYNKIRKLFGLKYFSLSKLAKVKIKKAAYFIHNFETALAEYAKLNGYDGVVCGHIHDPSDKMIDGIHYLNCGCWTDTSNMTYLIDTGDGTGLHLKNYHPEDKV